jgi:N-acetylglucosaminyldiphosphoundecaprenol N-acetyl-beta-D-mannosaminyltransferase
MNERILLMGCNIDNLTMGETLDKVAGFVQARTPHQHVVVNVDKLVKASRDPALRRIINACALVNVDGMPVVWASRLLGTPLKERVAGIDLFDALMGRAAQAGWRVFLLGAREAVVSAVAAHYEKKLPGLTICGWRDGYWQGQEEEAQVARQVRASRADLLFVAISSPQKEAFLDRHQGAMQVPFAMGVGGNARRAGCSGQAWNGFTGFCRSRAGCSGAIFWKTQPLPGCCCGNWHSAGKRCNNDNDEQLRRK